MTPKPERQITDKQALDQIQKILSGNEWKVSDLDDIANLVQLTGREIKDTASEEE